VFVTSLTVQKSMPRRGVNGYSSDGLRRDNQTFKQQSLHVPALVGWCQINLLFLILPVYLILF
jgi:hypothetical protein